jgi:Leucine-rich repeat (LRR) protein
MTSIEQESNEPITTATTSTRSSLLQSNEYELSRTYLEMYDLMDETDLVLIEKPFTSIELTAFVDLTNLTRLTINKTFLTSIEANRFDYLVNLKELFLADNRIVSVHPNSFTKLVNLELLCLNGNKLASIDPYTFKGLFKLKFINLHNNLFTQAKLFLYLEMSLSFISFKGSTFYNNISDVVSCIFLDFYSLFI